MPVLALPFGSIIDVPTARILARDDAGTGAAEALTNLQLFAILGTGTPDATTYLRGDGTWSTVTAGVGGSTGSVDNAVLRADGTGGATLQASSIIITDNYTSSPNATVNHASLQATGATTNVSVSIVPKGTGSFSLQVPDGTAAGGNVRGANAVDLQTSRTAAAQAATGTASVVLGGQRNTSTGMCSISGGLGCSATAEGAVAVGVLTQATINAAFAAGQSSEASSYASVALGYEVVAAAWFSFASGLRSRTNIAGSKVHAAGRFSANGDTQAIEMPPLRGQTTDGVTAVNLLANIFDGTTQEGWSIASGRVFTLLLQITGVKNGGGTVARFTREVTVKNVSNTVTLVGTVNTIGTDEAAGTSVSVAEDNTNKRLQVAPIGVANETWRWQCIARGGQISFG